MTHKHREIVIISLILLTLVLGWAYTRIASPTTFFFTMAILWVSAIFFIFWSLMISFVLIVIEIFVFGIVGVTLVWYNHSTLALQWYWIEIHSIFASLEILIWLTVILTKHAFVEIESLSARVFSLEKTIGTMGVLTRNEFLNQAQIILNGILRRNETGYLLSIQIDTTVIHAPSALLYTLTAIFVQTMRVHFDIVGQKDQNSFWILLQNTNEEGLRGFSKRIHRQILTELNEEIYRVLRIESRQIQPGDTLKSLGLTEDGE